MYKYEDTRSTKYIDLSRLYIENIKQIQAIGFPFESLAVKFQLESRRLMYVHVHCQTSFCVWCRPVNRLQD